MTGYPPYLVYDAPVRNGFLAPALEVATRARAEKLERDLRDIGECLWTAPDTVVVFDLGGRFAVAP